MQQANPYLNFHGRTEEAFTFYRSVFGGELGGMVRYRDMGVPGADPADGDLVAHVTLPLTEHVVLMGSDVSGGSAAGFQVGNNVQIYLAAGDADEAHRTFAALADGGEVAMPLQRTEWAELFGSCVDRFGVHWMVDYTGEVRYGPA